MLTPWEIVEKEMIPPAHLIKKNIASTCALFKVLLLNPGFRKRLKRQKDNKIYVRPLRKYALPEFKPGMKNLSKSEKYLRPTLYCNCRVPEITALAHQLGAFTKSGREFAEAAFEFSKRNITIEMVPLDDVSCTLIRGTGTCLQKIAVFVALCRAAGIPARFKFCALSRLDDIFAASLKNAPLIKKWFDGMGSFLLHGEGEAFIDNQWVTADISSGPQWQAAASLPITKLGESSVGLWIFPVPGSSFVRESVPLGMGNSSRILFKGLLASSLPGLVTTQ